MSFFSITGQFYDEDSFDDFDGNPSTCYMLIKPKSKKSSSRNKESFENETITEHLGGPAIVSLYDNPPPNSGWYDTFSTTGKYYFSNTYKGGNWDNDGLRRMLYSGYKVLKGYKLILFKTTDWSGTNFIQYNAVNNELSGDFWGTGYDDAIRSFIICFPNQTGATLDGTTFSMGVYSTANSNPDKGSSVPDTNKFKSSTVKKLVVNGNYYIEAYSNNDFTGTYTKYTTGTYSNVKFSSFRLFGSQFSSPVALSFIDCSKSKVTSDAGGNKVCGTDNYNDPARNNQQVLYKAY